MESDLVPIACIMRPFMSRPSEEDAEFCAMCETRRESRFEGRRENNVHRPFPLENGRGWDEVTPRPPRNETLSSNSQNNLVPRALFPGFKGSHLQSGARE